MLSGTTGLRGLTGNDIAALFGSAALSDLSKVVTPATASPSGKADKISGAALIGAGTSASRTIQAIVTQLQIEKSQTIVQGKASTFSLVSASMTFVPQPSTSLDPESLNSGVTIVDSLATAKGATTADAIQTLNARIKAEEADIMAARDGVLMSKEEIAFDGHSVDNLATWTSDSVTISSKGVANRGVELYKEEAALGGIQNVISKAAQYVQASQQSLPVADAQTKAGNDGLQLYMTIDVQNADLDSFTRKAQQLISDFKKGALAGQNGSPPTDGQGFSSFWTQEDQSGIEGTYNFNGVVIPKTSAVGITSAGNEIKDPAMNGVAAGGTIVSDTFDCTNGWWSLQIVVPLQAAPNDA